MTQTVPRTRPAPTVATVLRTERLSHTLVRVVLGGPALAGFPGSTYTDAYVKLSFLAPGVDYPRPLDLEWVRAHLPAEQWPVVRTYTVRSWDPAALELTVDFVVHGDSGIAGPWAASAQAGDEILLAGPGGGYLPDPTAGWHLLAGDESALPAIAAAVEAMPSDARGEVLIEVAGPESEIALEAPAAVRVRFLHTADNTIGETLVEAVRALTLPTDLEPHDVAAFVHGEAGFVKALRKVLRVDRKIPAHRLSISGYWRLGTTDEGWRAAKAQWNKECEELEQAAGAA